MRQLVTRVAAVAAILVVCSAHVGSPDAWFEGDAGPYHVVVQVATPAVVPGIANVYTRVDGPGVQQVTVQANRFDALAAAPPPEVAEPVDGDRGLYSAPLWIMSGGSNSVTVDVRGSLGTGKVVVPVVVVPNRRLELDPLFGAALGGVGIFLFVGLITIIGAAFRESVLPPGEVPDSRRKWKARGAMAVASALVALALVGGAQWWDLEDSRFNRSIFKPLKASAAIASGKSGKVLDLKISDSIWMMRNDTAWLRKNSASRWTPLLPDHGKLMHVFMVREPDLLAFAHLHPSSTDTVSFSSVLPPLPAGRYRVYGDIVHESGFTQTLSASVDLPESTNPNAKPNDPDDASHVGAATPNGTSVTLADGSVMTMDRRTGLVEGRDASLRFTVTDRNGTPLALEPYIGMAGHAVVSRDDGAVFIHLHPSGTISMASQMAFMMRQPGDTIAGRLGQRIKASESMHSVVAAVPENGVISFPYAFPKPGKYHLWVQVKHAGRILTGAFAVEVNPAKV
jgi:hypothetical protein